MTIPMVVSLSILIKIRMRIWNVDLGRQIRILGVDLVQYIDKRSIFDVDYSTNRYNSSRGFQNDTHRLDTTAAREVREEKVDLDISDCIGLEYKASKRREEHFIMQLVYESFPKHY